MTREITFAMGALSDPVGQQLAAQGIKFDADLIGHLDKDMRAVSRLKVRGVVGYAAGEKLYDKIAKKIWTEIARANPPESSAADDGGTPLTPGQYMMNPNTIPKETK